MMFAWISRKRKIHPVVVIGPVRTRRRLEGKFVFTLTDEQEVPIALAFETQAGNPAKIDGKPSWSVSDESILSLEVTDDGMSANVVTTGKLGTSQLRIEVDADLGEGVRAVSGTLDIEVVPAAVSKIVINPGQPVVKQPNPTP
jgi:hypothetical protein